MAVDITPAGGTSSATDPAPDLDSAQQTICSATGEVVWNYGVGLVTINPSVAQGAASFRGRALRFLIEE